jgi:RimJ/RimL family protein N-acetyltransferase
MLRGERVTLRPTERADLPKLWELLEDMDVAILAEGGPVVPTSLSRYEARFDRQIVDPPDDRIEFVIEADGEVVGQCQLHYIDRFNRRCDLGIALGRDHWGKGLGQDAVRLLVDYAFTHLDLRRVGLRVLADDARAVGAYTKAGFVEEGRLRGYSIVEGRARDDLLMAAIRDDSSPRT